MYRIGPNWTSIKVLGHIGYRLRPYQVNDLDGLGRTLRCHNYNNYGLRRLYPLVS